MQQLLRITNIPIEYQYQIEHARLEASRESSLGYQLDRRPSSLQMKSENIKVRTDTVDMRRSMGLRSTADSLTDAAQRGKQAAMDATAQYAEDGNQMARGVDISQIIADKMFAQPTTVTAFIPKVGPAITWQPSDLQMKYDPGDISMNWQMMRNAMDYVPGKFHMNILQYPKVNIEYTGEPHYVPPSANPNYQE